MNRGAPWRALPPALTVASPAALSRALHEAGAPQRPLARLHERASSMFATKLTYGVDSGTSALRLAIELAKLPGRPVALPAFGCFDLLTALVGSGQQALYYDVDPNTLGPDLDSLDATLRDGAGAVVVASIFGYPPSMTAISERCQHHGAVLIEDIAQGIGASAGGRPLGSWGDFVTMSFGRGKGVGGAGGGALLVRDLHRAMHAGLPVLSASAALKGVIGLFVQQVLAHPSIFALPSALPFLALGETVYHDPWPPHAAHPLQLALANESLAVESTRRDERADTAGRIRAAISSNESARRELCLTTLEKDATPGYLRLGARANHDVIARARSAGLRRGYPISLVDHAQAQHAARLAPDVRGARELAQRLCSIPTHRWVSEADIAALIAVCAPGARRNT